MKSELQNVCDRFNIKCEAEMVGENPNMGGDMPAGSYHYKVRLSRNVPGYGPRQITTYFSCGPAWDREPQAADVLSCLISDARSGEESFEDFCSELGYDSDSRQAERIWRTCRKVAPKVERFLADDREEFENAEH
jgi:hypothetical protein